MHLRVMRVWVAFYTLYLGLIKVLGHWSEVGTCVESSEPQLGTYVAQAILHLCSGGGLAQPAKGQMLGLLEDLPMRWVFPLLKTCFLPAPPPRSCPPWPGARGAAEHGTLSLVQPTETQMPGPWLWQGLLTGAMTRTGR